MTTMTNKHIRLWLEGRLSEAHEIAPVRIVATPEARCNLRCEHCYWEHDLKNAGSEIDWSPAVERIGRFYRSAIACEATLQVPYAGRTLSRRGAGFLDALIQGVPIARPPESGPPHEGVDIAIIDNGYTVFNRPDFLPLYQYVNISVDGFRPAHDRQRQRSGSFDVAWGAILRLKEMGYDPISASALGPLSRPGWEQFEDLLAEHDVRSSVTFVWDMEATRKRQVASIGDSLELISIFEMLIDGVPKLINLYDMEHVRILMPILRELEWHVDAHSGDGLMTACNGSHILYRPVAPAFFREIELLWDGTFQTLESCGRAPIDAVTDQHLRRVFDLAFKEREIWADVTIGTGCSEIICS